MTDKKGVRFKGAATEKKVHCMNCINVSKIDAVSCVDVLISFISASHLIDLVLPILIDHSLYDLEGLRNTTSSSSSSDSSSSS